MDAINFRSMHTKSAGHVQNSCRHPGQHTDPSSCHKRARPVSRERVSFLSKCIRTLSQTRPTECCPLERISRNSSLCALTVSEMRSDLSASALSAICTVCRRSVSTSLSRFDMLSRFCKPPPDFSTPNNRLRTVWHQVAHAPPLQQSAPRMQQGEAPPGTQFHQNQEPQVCV